MPDGPTDPPTDRPTDRPTDEAADELRLRMDRLLPTVDTDRALASVRREAVHGRRRQRLLAVAAAFLVVMTISGVAVAVRRDATTVVSTADDDTSPATDGSSPPVADATTTTTEPAIEPAPGGTDAIPTATTSTTTEVATELPVTTATTTTTTAPIGRGFDPNGLTFAGLAPVTIGMSAQELSAATGYLSALADESSCVPNGIIFPTLPDGVSPSFDPDGRLEAIYVSGPDFATPEGFRVPSSLAELEATYTDLEPVRLTHGDGLQRRSPDGTRLMTFSLSGDTVVGIIVSGDPLPAERC